MIEPAAAAIESAFGDMKRASHDVFAAPDVRFHKAILTASSSTSPHAMPAHRAFGAALLDRTARNVERNVASSVERKAPQSPADIAFG